MKHIGWARGGEARIVSIEGERVRLSSTTPAAPGTPLEGALDDGTRVKVKVARCRRDEAGFTIEGRLVDASREVRATLAALASPEGEPPS
jgi:hypothetical protein